MGGERGNVERAMGAIAERQHGVVTRRQLLAAGVTRREIERRAAKGSLIAVHRGVYRVGHFAPSVPATYLAAVLACGEGAALSASAAAYSLGLVGGSPPPPEVTASGGRRVPGVRTRRCRTVGDEDRIIRNGVPVTSVPRTLVDLAARLSLDDLVNACHEAA